MERVTTSEASQDYIDTGHKTFVLRDEDRERLINALLLAGDIYTRNAITTKEAGLVIPAFQFTVLAARAADMRAILAGERDF